MIHSVWAKQAMLRASFSYLTFEHDDLLALFNWTKCAADESSEL